MPGSTKTEIKCVKCKTLFETEVIDHIDLSEDGDLIKNLRTGKANRVKCSKCKKVMYLDRSIVINFEPQSLIVMYDPKAKTKKSKEEWLEEYENVVSFNEILSELSEETEFKVVSKLDELKKLLTAYTKIVA
ncbi:MAG: CpXC domain-containing protein [Candidatus Thorarchaeota archaeon]